MTEHRGRFVALLVGLLLVGLAFAPAGGAAAAKQRAAHVDPQGVRRNLAGRGMWIWYISRSAGGTLSSIIATARQYGVSTLIIKSGDGRDMWSQFNPHCRLGTPRQRPARVRVAVRLWEPPDAGG